MCRNKFGLGLAVLSGLLFFTALIFVILSCYGRLLMNYPQHEAALIVSGVVTGVSFILGLIAMLLLKHKKQPAVQDNEITMLISQITDAFGEDLAEHIRDNPKTAVLLAGAAGLIAGERLHN